MAEAADYHFKVLMIGDKSVGKSSLIRRFHDDKFDNRLCTTIGVDFFIHDLELDGKRVKVKLKHVMSRTASYLQVHHFL